MGKWSFRRKLTSNQAWYWLGSKLIRPTYGFSRCIEQQFLVLTLDPLLLRYWVKMEAKKANNKRTKKKRKVIQLLMRTHKLRHKLELKLNKPLCKNRLKLKELIKIEKRRKKKRRA